jgi:hypothetical protein
MGPLGKLWSNIYQKSEDEEAPNFWLDEILTNLEQATILVAQTVKYCNQQRRWNALKLFYDNKEDIKTTIDNHQEDFENETKFLFGKGCFFFGLSSDFG